MINRNPIYVGDGKLLCLENCYHPYRLYLDARDLGFTPAILENWYEETWLIKFLDMIEADTKVVDVGANIGYHTVLAGKRMQSKRGRGKILAIEPNPRSFEILRMNIDTNHIMAEALQCAVSDTAGEASFWVDRDFSVGSHLMDQGMHPETNHGFYQTVDVQKLENICSFIPDVVKIDVEGNELNVLKGMTSILKLNRAMTLFIEVHNYTEDSKENEILEFLRRYHFSLNYRDTDMKASICPFGRTFLKMEKDIE